MPTEVKRAIRPRVVAGLLAVLSASVIAVACLGQQMTFDHLRGADRVEIRTNNNQLVKTIRDPAVISAAQAAIARHDAGWKTPWYGAPVPALQVNFFRDVRLLGGYGVGGDFLTTDPGPSFMSRSITRQEVDEITLLLGVALPSR